MSEQVPITISKPLFERLQKHAAPLVDTTDTVIERLLNFWEHKPTKASSPVQSTSSNTPKFWRSSRGDVLPVGLSLTNTYLGKSYTAVVEGGGIRFNGELYGDLSPAAMAVKRLAGKTGDTVSTNGRDFWRLRNPATNQLMKVSSLRPNHRFKVDANELLAELGNTLNVTEKP